MGRAASRVPGPLPAIEALGSRAARVWLGSRDSCSEKTGEKWAETGREKSRLIFRDRREVKETERNGGNCREVGLSGEERAHIRHH